jgi:hypothetical protein
MRVLPLFSFRPGACKRPRQLASRRGVGEDVRVRVLLAWQSGLYRLATVDVSHRDGSINVKFPRNGENPAAVTWREGSDARPRSVSTGRLRTRKITIHASGQVNDNRRDGPIFLEPLTRVSVPWVVAYFRFLLLDGSIYTRRL